MSQAGTFVSGGGPVPPTVVETLTGNTGGPVGPNGNNIYLLGATGEINIAGNAGSSTLIVSLAAQSGLFTATTVGATTEPLITIPIANPEGVVFIVTLIAVVSDYSGSAGGTFTTTASNNGGGAVISGTGGDLQDSIAGGGTIPLAFFTVSGNDVIFNVTGVAGITINWKAYFNFLLI